MIEKWKKVPDNPLLWVSTLGRIKSEPYEVKMPKGGFRIRELKPTYGITQRIGKNYYRKIVVFRRKSYRIAPLVCITFHGSRPENCVASHKDENGMNNIYTNLEWVTQKVNANMPKIKEYQRKACVTKMSGKEVN